MAQKAAVRRLRAKQKTISLKKERTKHSAYFIPHILN